MKISRKLLNPAAGYAILSIEEGKARDTRPTPKLLIDCYY